MPVEAPLGTMAEYLPLVVATSTSTVGLPRESKIWRATHFVIFSGDALLASVSLMCAHGSSALALTQALIASSTMV